MVGTLKCATVQVAEIMSPLYHYPSESITGWSPPGIKLHNNKAPRSKDDWLYCIHVHSFGTVCLSGHRMLYLPMLDQFVPNLYPPPSDYCYKFMFLVPFRHKLSYTPVPLKMYNTIIFTLLENCSRKMCSNFIMLQWR